MYTVAKELVGMQSRCGDVGMRDLFKSSSFPGSLEKF